MNLPSQELSTIAALSRSRATHRFKAGDVIYQPGDLGDVLYGVVSGEIRLGWGAAMQERVGPGACFGVGALLDPEHRRFDSAIAMTDAELLEMDRHDFLFAMQELPMFGLEMLDDLERRLHQLKRSVAER